MSEKKANKNSHTKERLKTTIADPEKNTQAINAEKKKPQNSKRASSTKKSHKIAQPSTISSVTKTVSQEKISAPHVQDHEYVVPHVRPPSQHSFEIVVKNLHKHFGKKKAVNGINFNIHSSEMVGILGPNGAGKTTAFYMIVGFLKPSAGTIILNNIDITRYPMYKRAQLGISYLPQEASVYRQLSVEKNITAVLQTIKNISRKERIKRLDTLLDEFGITHLRKQKAYTLSGGERRRTEIARCMALNPKFILLDEPFTGIDPKARHELKQIIASLSKRNIGVLITDHNERDTLSIIDRAFIVYNGKIIIGGSRDEIVQNVRAKDVYLGEHYD